jgi:hypothetical protein
MSYLTKDLPIFLVGVVLVLFGVFGFLYILKFLFTVLSPYQTQTECKIQFTDNSIENAQTCTAWREDSFLSCKGNKRYSFHAIKSWSCK